MLFGKGEWTFNKEIDYMTYLLADICTEKRQGRHGMRRFQHPMHAGMVLSRAKTCKVYYFGNGVMAYG